MLITTPFQVLDANIVSSNVPENDAAPYNPATGYVFGELCIVTQTDIHNVYKSVFAGTNTGNNPLADNLDNPTYWSLVGATNKYRMFDSYVSSQSSNPDSITFSVTDLGVVNTIALINCEGAEASITVTDEIDGVVYEDTIALVSYSGITSYYQYYFGPVYLKSFALFENIPPYLDATITITINNPGATAKIGAFVGGYGYYFGSIKYGSDVNRKDYSIKTQLPTGDYYFKEGAFAYEGNFEFDFENEQFDLLQTLLASNRAKPSLYVAYAEYEATLYFGLVTAAPTTLSYTQQSTCRMKIESLI